MKLTPESTRLRRIMGSILFCVMIVAEFTYAGMVLRPSGSGAVGGAAWIAFEELEPDTADVVFFGSSHAFTAVDPAVLWRQRGIPAFVHAGPTQMLEVTEYYMRETLKTQRPRVIALEMASSSYSTRTFRPNFHAMNVGLMPWSENKLAASWFATPPDMRVNILLDVWAYHGRWSELTSADFALGDKDDQATYLMGFNPNTRTEVVESATYIRPESDYPIANAGIAHNRETLRRIAQLCEDNDIELLLFLAPTGPPESLTYYMMSAAEDLQQRYRNVAVLDLSSPGAVPDLSYETDFRDGGHLNWRGAEKVSRVLADFMTDTYDLSDRRSSAAHAAWSDAAAKRDEHIARISGESVAE